MKEHRRSARRIKWRRRGRGVIAVVSVCTVTSFVPHVFPYLVGECSETFVHGEPRTQVIMQVSSPLNYPTGAVMKREILLSKMRKCGKDADALHRIISAKNPHFNCCAFEEIEKAATFLASTEYSTDDSFFTEFDDFKDVRFVGCGSFASVLKAKWRDRDVAVKVFHVYNLHRVEFWRDEVTSLKKISRCGSKNFPEFIGPCWIGGVPGFVMEYCEGQSLDDYLKTTENEIADDMVNRLGIAKSLAEALREVEEQSVAHADVKPMNVIVQLSEDNAFKGLKLIDFGLSEDLTRPRWYQRGTYGYMAPEVSVKRRVTTAADVYAFGTVLSDLFSKCYSKRHNDVVEFDLKSARKTTPTVASASSHAFFCRCRSASPRIAPLSNLAVSHYRPDISTVPLDILGLIVQCWHPKASRRPSWNTIIDRLKSIDASLLTLRQSSTTKPVLLYRKCLPSRYLPTHEPFDDETYKLVKKCVDESNRIFTRLRKHFNPTASSTTSTSGTSVKSTDLTEETPCSTTATVTPSSPTAWRTWNYVPGCTTREIIVSDTTVE